MYVKPMIKVKRVNNGQVGQLTLTWSKKKFLKTDMSSWVETHTIASRVLTSPRAKKSLISSQSMFGFLNFNYVYYLSLIINYFFLCIAARVWY